MCSVSSAPPQILDPLGGDGIHTKQVTGTRDETQEVGSMSARNRRKHRPASHGVRGGDSVCRMGGDEFAVICPQTTLDEGQRIAERIRSKVAAIRVALGDHNLAVSVSIGVALHLAGQTAEALTEGADAALYAAKRAGRDRARVSLPIAPITRSDQTSGNAGGNERVKVVPWSRPVRK